MKEHRTVAQIEQEIRGIFGKMEQELLSFIDKTDDRTLVHLYKTVFGIRAIETVARLNALKNEKRRLLESEVSK